MPSHHRGHLTGGTFATLLAGGLAGGSMGCSATRVPVPQSQAPVSVAASHTPTAVRSPARFARRRAPASVASASSNVAVAGLVTPPRDAADVGPAAQSDLAELVVSRDVVGQCPRLRGVREHVGELSPDTIWVAVLESLATCMGKDGPLAEASIDVSGDEPHRLVVRDVLEARGIAPTRVGATPSPNAMSAMTGVAECQGGGQGRGPGASGVGCASRVEITIAPSP